MHEQYKMAPAGEHAVVWKGLKKQRNTCSALLFFGELRASNAGMICAACVRNKVPESLSVAFLSPPPTTGDVPYHFGYIPKCAITFCVWGVSADIGGTLSYLTPQHRLVALFTLICPCRTS